jgi:hypothetical protein
MHTQLQFLTYLHFSFYSNDHFLDPYKLAARYILRGINPFFSLLQAFQLATKDDPDDTM